MSIRYTSEQLQRKFPGAAASPGYARVADALRAEGRLDEAIALCREGLRSRPRVAGYVVLGKALVDAGGLEEARGQFEAALRLDPRCLSALRMLARIMEELQWADAAVGYYRSILELDPWDAEIRSLLAGRAPGAVPGMVPGAAPGAPQGASPGAAPAREAETFVKPEGLQGDLLEVNLNDFADEFLPSGGDGPGASLEAALANDSARSPAGDYSPVSDAAAGPERLGANLSVSGLGPETLGENAPAPISGSDVEERLDSLFGAEDGANSSTATWTAAPAAPDAVPGGSGTAAGELRPLPGLPEASADPAPFDFAELPDSAAPSAASERGPFDGLGEAAPVASVADRGMTDEDVRVQGDDIERRLDELFHMVSQDDRPSLAPLSASDLPVAPPPKVGESVSMGAPVAFGKLPSFPGAETDPLAGESEIVTGQDVADKLDSLFGPDPKAKSPAPGAVGSVLPAAGETMLSTDSLAPSLWTEDAAQVTGADVEAQLDKLFHPEPSAPADAARAEAAFETAPEAAPGQPAGDPPRAGHAALPQRDQESPIQGNLDETVSFAEPPIQVAQKENPGLKESVADWLARQGDTLDFDDTLILPPEGPYPEATATIAAERPVEETFGTLAQEDLPALNEPGDTRETGSIEMVDGGDVAERLDKFFSDTQDAAAPEIPLFAPDEPPVPDFGVDPEAGATLEFPAMKLDEADPDDSASAFLDGIAPGIGDKPESAAAHSGAPETIRTVPELSPMLDEEDGYPEEEDMPATPAGANVATVTLAEIYFQQGLKEQALQIYRQLLEREPENDSVRKRISEIETFKSEGDRGPDSDPRRPRPGLKVPKRKK